MFRSRIVSSACQWLVGGLLVTGCHGDGSSGSSVPLPNGSTAIGDAGSTNDGSDVFSSCPYACDLIDHCDDLGLVCRPAPEGYCASHVCIGKGKECEFDEDCNELGIEPIVARCVEVFDEEPVKHCRPVDSILECVNEKTCPEGETCILAGPSSNTCAQDS